MNLIPYVLSLSLVLVPLQISPKIDRVEEKNEKVEIVQQDPKLSSTSIIERKEAVYNLAETFGNKYNVNPEILKKVLTCENNQYDTNLQSYHKADTFNGRELSFGLSQIHLPSHPSVSIEQATDPHFSVEFMAKEISQGNGKMWTCYRQIYGVK